MVFRITEEGGAGATTLRLAGRLAEDAPDVLVDACADVTAGVTVDLAEVHYADERGVTALADLEARGAILRGARPYLALLLEQEASLRHVDGKRARRVRKRGRS